MARSLLNGERIISKEYVFYGHTSSIKKILKHARLLLPNSDNEYRRLYRSYQIEKEFEIIPNAVDDMFLLQNTAAIVKDPTMIISVARIEGLKNQLNLIRALNNTSYSLLLIGNISINQNRYYEQCRKEAAGNIHFVPYVMQQKLVEYYQKAKVHVLASWFETTGLSSLEAAAMGCNVVITDKGDTREYFGDDAFYCNPSSPESIYLAIESAAKKEQNNLSSKIAERYTWKHTADKTAAAYHRVLIS